MNDFYISPDTSFSGAGQISKYYHLVIDFILPIFGTCDISKQVNCYINNIRLDPRRNGVLPGSLSSKSMISVINDVFDNFNISDNHTNKHSNIWLTNQQKIQFDLPEIFEDVKFKMDFNRHSRSRGLWSLYPGEFYKKMREHLWKKITVKNDRYVTCVLRKTNNRGSGNDDMKYYYDNIKNNISNKYTLKTIYLEDMEFLEQVSLFYHTDFLLAQHGAGMTNCAFMRPGSTIVELPPVTYPCYQILSKQCGHKHYFSPTRIYENIFNN